MYQSLKEYIRLKTGLRQSSQEVRDAEARLTARLDFLSSFINLTWPSRLELDPIVLEKALEKISREFGQQDFETAIHKNDLMFAFHLNRHPHDPVEALFSYYRVGLGTARNLQSIVENYGLKPSRLVDFGAGYGRVSRFLPALFQDANCVVTEVKEQAIRFQEEELGLNGIIHSQNPDDFPSEKFDLLLALSVFTHLPEDLFRAWMQNLGERMRETGAMVITFLDQGREESQEILKNFITDPGGFEYIRRSEDSYFTFVSDRLKDDGLYGSSFITRPWLEELVNSLGLRVEFLDYTLVKSQDAAIIMHQ
jgi:cyclopropane fatty-acyl-phospholipid synthase-like methyltransferase